MSNDPQLPGHAMLFQGVPHYTDDQMREYGRARQQADETLLRQAGFAFRSVWAVGLTGENVHQIEAAMLAIEARLGADK
jgi:hypothetical protein